MKNSIIIKGTFYSKENDPLIFLQKDLILPKDLLFITPIAEAD